MEEERKKAEQRKKTVRREERAAEKRRAADKTNRQCPSCGKPLRHGTNSDWNEVYIWWCDTVNPPYGCGYEITPSTHPEEFRGYLSKPWEDRYA
jgi:hypothetical protein